MQFIKLLFTCFFWLFVFDSTHFIIGIIAFKLGAKKLGHSLIGHIGSSFGLTQHWLYDNCPYEKGHKCRLWTCKGYGTDPVCPCKCNLTM